MQVRPCLYGEQAVPLPGSGSSDDDTLGSQPHSSLFQCSLCPAGSFNPNLGDSASCVACDDTCICPGGAVLVPHEGMWHDGPLEGRVRVCYNPKACRADKEDR